MACKLDDFFIGALAGIFAQKCLRFRRLFDTSRFYFHFDNVSEKRRLRYPMEHYSIYSSCSAAAAAATAWTRGNGEKKGNRERGVMVNKGVMVNQGVIVNQGVMVNEG